MTDNLVSIRIKAGHELQEVTQHLFLVLLVSILVDAKNYFGFAELRALNIEAGNRSHMNSDAQDSS